MAAEKLQGLKELSKHFAHYADEIFLTEYESKNYVNHWNKNLQKKPCKSRLKSTTFFFQHQ